MAWRWLEGSSWGSIWAVATPLSASVCLRLILLLKQGLGYADSPVRWPALTPPTPHLQGPGQPHRGGQMPPSTSKLKKSLGPLSWFTLQTRKLRPRRGCGFCPMPLQLARVLVRTSWCLSACGLRLWLLCGQRFHRGGQLLVCGCQTPTRAPERPSLDPPGSGEGTGKQKAQRG